ncbi:MAG TPA: hypothetical protein VHO29_18990 [Marmoricola sp.]|nr:hypothetical protein [Marmoricola sp.]
MKSALSRSVLGRRVASAAVLGLAAATLSVGLAGSATAAGPDVEGTVTGVGGAPLTNICVDAFDATNDRYLQESCTGADGKYSFSGLVSGMGVSSIKLDFYDNSGFDYTGDTFYLERWYGGAKYRPSAAAVGITDGGDTVKDFVMTPASIISGTISAADGHAFTDGYNLDVFNTDMEYAWSRSTGDVDGKSYKIAVEPGTYRVGGYGWDAQTATAPWAYYLEKWWVDSDTAAGATPITVGAGQTVTGINLALTDKLSARQAPSIRGFAAVGRALTASPGTWSRNAGNEFTYTWMRGATVVGTGANYTPTAADLGQRLNVVVRAVNGTNVGQAASAQTDPVRWPADAKGKAKRLGHHQVRFAVKLVSAHQKPVKGKVVVLRGTKVVHKAVKLVKGKAVIVVKGQPKGKQTFTVHFKGNKKLAQVDKTFTVRVRK